MRAKPEIWGGVECTVNRVGDCYRDQLVLTGHHDRLDDLDRIRDLGVTTVRYPVLWERTCPTPGEYDWRWSDERLARLKDLGIEPVVGLVHHGSGPRWTSLVDESFVSGLEEYAGRVADRYPWVRRFTIVNEPLTTARFCGLYGLWYPHERNDRSFVQALLIQCRAIRSAMTAIRRRQPEAELVQTEDVSRTTADASTRGQAWFYQERSWLSLDLLTGRVTTEHPLWPYLTAAGADERLLQSFVDLPCPPSLIGTNYYVTSDRHLVERTDNFAGARHFAGGAWFVDVESVRTGMGIAGHGAHLRAVWNRYRTPLAVTEVQLDASGNDQARWLLEAWNAACAATVEGIPVRAVTAWALFGSVDWNSLVTRPTGYYERGAFDVRGGRVRPRAISRVIRHLATEGVSEDPVARGSGWWRRQTRSSPAAAKPAVRVAIFGGGTLARAVAHACEQRGLPYNMLTRGQVDAAETASVERTLEELRPWAVVNATGYVRVDQAQRDTARCWRDNAVAPAVLADASARFGTRFVTFSSDLVFDGKRSDPYLEEHAVGPLSVYGQSKAAAESAVLRRLPSALVIRTAAFFGPHDSANFLVQALQQAHRGREWRAAHDLIVSPTYVPDLADATLELLFDDAAGRWHVTSGTPLSWADFAREAIRRFGLSARLICDCSSSDLDLIAPRPSFSALASARGLLMPGLDSALDRFVEHLNRELLAETHERR